MNVATSLRVDDLQREAVARRLSDAVGTGQLTIAEFDERVASAYRSTTVEELDALTADLTRPRPVEMRRSARPVTGCGHRGYRLATRIEWSAWLGVGLINLIVWAAVSLGTASLIYFWPVWVIGPWGAVLLARSAQMRIGGLASPRRQAT